MAQVLFWICDECATCSNPDNGKNALQGWQTVSIDYHGEHVSCKKTVSLRCPSCAKLLENAIAQLRIIQND